MKYSDHGKENTHYGLGEDIVKLNIFSFYRAVASFDYKTFHGVLQER